MILSILIAFSKSIEPIPHVTEMMKEERYRQAFDTAAMYINKQGMLDADPHLFFLRGQCAYQITKFEDSIKDLSRFLTSGSATNEEKKKAYLVRGQARMRLGLLDDAESDAKLSSDRALKRQISETKANLDQAQIYEKNEKWEDAIETYEKLLKVAISSVSYLVSACQCALKLGDKDKFMELSHKAMQISPKDPSLLELRGKFFLCDGDTDMAAKHFKICRQYASDASSCTILLKAATNFQEQHKKALNHTNKKDYQAAAPAISQCENIAKRRCTENSPLATKVKTLIVKAKIAEGKTREALSYLNDLIKQSPNATDLLLERADILLDEHDLDGAMKDYQQARKVSPHNKRAEKGIEKVGKMQDDEKNVDFYEVLGLRRGASVSQVKDAYRKQARVWHPDRYSDPAKKREAERMMKNINRAYDVLTDPEKKQLYDMGQDPENPGMGQGGGGGQGFQGGFNPFEFFQQGGANFGGGNFRFHFG
ncbi:DnaJ domain containing protein [Tritrichomonas foetus]|uniref:DnaJ domain containing protein n=1 Tax=Tritrichomonas foetus TaxID=1144522 RepID=A0A1J4K2X3_9EUKA|nr:DnaJ domain containing protein [Tritrichomonas foetus]|eukprot:OHT05793.1 DnaJ domain containing protein [Tritrichomonas foetus]